MRWPVVLLVAACAAGAGFGAGRFTAAPAPVPDQWEIRTYGYNNNHAMKLNKRTGETWRQGDHGWVRVP